MADTTGSPFDHFKEFKEEVPVQELQVTEGQTIDEPIVQNTDAPKEIIKEPVKVEAPKQDEFIETFNKRYNATYKSEDEIKSLFDLPKKMATFEEKAKDRDELARSIEQYKKDLEELKRTENARYLSKPLMRKAFVAEQLLEKYPNSDPFVLQEIAMTDVDKKEDIDVLVMNQKIKLPNMKADSLRLAILSDLGIDADTPPQEWDDVAKAKIAMRAADARENIKKLTEGIQLPQAENPEEVRKQNELTLQKRVETIAPLKAEYSQYDKFNIMEGLDYTVDDDFKSKLGDMFDAFILKAGNEPTAENLETIKSLREALFFTEHKKAIYDVMYKDAETKVKKQLDEKLGNTVLPNTSTASDDAGNAGSGRPGVSEFRRDNFGTRVRQI
jgi:hypothetical protein